VSKLVAIVKLADDMVTEWLMQLAQIPGLSARIASMADSSESLAPSKMPSLDQIANGDFDDAIDRAKEVFMFIALSHFQGGLKWLAHALDGMLDPMNPKDPKPVSVGFVMDSAVVESLPTLGPNSGQPTNGRA
jgi:hypothetical protein